MAATTEYRLAFVVPRSRELLGIIGSDELPRISIPPGQRPAEKLTELIERKWQVKTVVIDFLSNASIPSPCAIIEVRTPSWEFRNKGFYPMDPEAIRGTSLGDDERQTLISILSGVDTGRGPFSRLGWIEVAQHWIQEEVLDREIAFSEDLRQLNANGDYALIRFGTRQGPAHWLKAVPVGNQDELRITRTLSRYFTSHLPRMIASREDWNAWVMEEGGIPLEESFDLTSLESAISCLAELQQESINHIHELLAIGCLDHRTSALEDRLLDLREYLQEAMDRQTATHVPKLGPHRLRELESIIRDACCALRDIAVPDTLIHNDVNPGNILVDGSCCVFIDWCDAFVGNPFLTFHHLCAHIARESRNEPDWLLRIRAIYKERWLGYLTEAQIDRSFVVTPIVAMTSYLYGRGQLLQSTHRGEPMGDTFSRSLARQIDRAARNPEFLEALCRSL